METYFNPLPIGLFMSNIDCVVGGGWFPFPPSIIFPLELEIEECDTSPKSNFSRPTH